MLETIDRWVSIYQTHLETEQPSDPRHSTLKFRSPTRLSMQVLVERVIKMKDGFESTVSIAVGFLFVLLGDMLKAIPISRRRK